MKKAMLLGVAVVILAALLGCQKRLQYPLCRSDADCREGEMCANGKCVLCRSDADCPEGHRCIEGACAITVAKSPSEKEGQIAAAEVEAPHSACSLPLGAVYFDFDSAELKPEAREVLKEIAQCLIEKGTKEVTIIGHCDPRGTEEYNMGLGLERANAIRKFLASYGVPQEVMKVYSKGEEEASGYDEETWAKDRRGEIK